MYTLPKLQQYTNCECEGERQSGKVIALSNDVGVQQICFLFKNDKKGTWLPIESLFDLTEKNADDES